MKGIFVGHLAGIFKPFAYLISIHVYPIIIAY